MDDQEICNKLLQKGLRPSHGFMKVSSSRLLGINLIQRSCDRSQRWIRGNNFGFLTIAKVLF